MDDSLSLVIHDIKWFALNRYSPMASWTFKSILYFLSNLFPIAETYQNQINKATILIGFYLFGHVSRDITPSVNHVHSFYSQIKILGFGYTSIQVIQNTNLYFTSKFLGFFFLKFIGNWKKFCRKKETLEKRLFIKCLEYESKIVKALISFSSRSLKVGLVDSVKFIYQLCIK
ncbi:hypothetical protein BpHYR1_046293 [Brachionus plicatilis]|uniref:Uncharacterized protein n=1 Tax=Brachionus plicatilis TaxID=10195 RepID=A0A3M7PVD4_BRAPC|nr:hypothetical protein BpHYR1_046293 [Brachionus plicatilis]